MPEAWQKTWPLPLIKEEGGQSTFDTKDRIYYKNLFSTEYKANNAEWETNPSKDGLVNEEAYNVSFTFAEQRNGWLQSIGNLTLVTGRHNSSLSNSPFPENRASLGENSILILNREICDQRIGIGVKFLSGQKNYSPIFAKYGRLQKVLLNTSSNSINFTTRRKKILF